MNKNAQLWVEALRSGEFEQGRGRLRCGAKLCCLGVACEVYRREVGGEWVDGKEFLGHLTTLPRAVCVWLGLQGRFGDFLDHRQSLVGLNDRGKTFAEIADIIEQQPKGLFVDSRRRNR